MPGPSVNINDVMMIMQLAIEVLLVVLMLIILKRSNRAGQSDPARMPENLKNSIEKFLTESEKIAAVFDRNLSDKKELSADLILKLDRRLSDYKVLLQEAETSFAAARKQLDELKRAMDVPKVPQAPAAAGKANPAAPEVRALVLQMARKGHTPEEIATKARLHLGEVELIIDLERQFTV